MSVTPTPERGIHLEILHNEFQKRVAKNHRYSLRAYSRSLGVHCSALSRLMSGKLVFATKCGVDVAKKLPLTQNQRRLFVRSIVESREAMSKRVLGEMLETPDLRPEFKKLTADQYAKAARVDMLALMELTKVASFKPEAAWIAQALGRSVGAIEEALKTLIEANLLKKHDDGTLTACAENLCAIDEVDTNAVHQALQKEVLEKSQASLSKVPFDRRLHYGITMAINPNKIGIARERISKFLDDLSDELETDPEKKEVYQLAISYFPLSACASGTRSH